MKLINSIFCLVSILNLVLVFVFNGILADEGVNVNNFAKAYFLGFEFSFYLLNIFQLFLFVFSIFLLVLNLFSLAKK